MDKQAKTFLQYFLIAVLIISIVGIYFVVASCEISWDAQGKKFSTAGDVTRFSVNESVTQLYNITINNTDIGATMNITQVNITVNGLNFTLNTWNSSIRYNLTFLNSSNVLSWTNITPYLINGSGSSNTSSVTLAHFWFNATGTIPGIYNITIRTYSGGGSNTTNLTVQINDSIPPAVSYTTGTPANSTNSTQNWIFVNVSVTDTYPWNITFRLYTAAQAPYNYTNKSFEANGSMLTLNNTVNWTGLADGQYFYNVTVNDRASLTLTGSQSTTTTLKSITIDTVAPNISYTCDDYTVTRGENKMLCTCTAADTWDAEPTIAIGTYSSEGTTSSVYPSTIVVGTFSTTCTVTDIAGNSASSKKDYTVTAPGATSVGGGGGGGTTYTKTIVEDSKEFSEIGSITKSMQSNQQIRIKVDKKTHNIGVVELSATTAKIEIFSTLQTATLSVGDTRRFDVTADGYYDLSVTLNKIESNKADITIKSIKEKITEETTAAEQAQETGTGAVAQEEESALPTEKNLNWTWIIIGIVVVLILIGIGYYIKKRR